MALRPTRRSTSTWTCMRFSHPRSLRAAIERFFENGPPDEIRELSTGAEIAFPSVAKSLRLTRGQLRLLFQKKLPTVAGLSLIERCGVAWHNYSEIFVHISGVGEWPAHGRLRFRIGETSVEVGPPSPAAVFLLESYYEYEDFGQTGFEIYESIRLFPVAAENATNVLLQALFYLNSHYLRPGSGAAQPRYLRLPKDDEDGYDGYREPNLHRARVRNRPPLVALEPVLIFNDAVLLHGESRFLGFYRVLEYFFHRALVASVAAGRLNAALSDEALITMARTQKELPQLASLLAAILTPAEKQRLSSFAAYRRLIAKPDARLIPEALYLFRNSLVHAKEAEIGRTTLPDPFKIDEITDHWAFIAETCAVKAIRRLNSVHGA